MAVEGAGEDPWLAARFGEAKVRGYQGPGLTATDGLSGCAKHFCGYGRVLAGREYAPSNIAPREVYLPPFEAAVRAGGAAIMPSLNALDGVPMTANRALLQGWLRDRLGFDGIVISDYGVPGSRRSFDCRRCVPGYSDTTSMTQVTPKRSFNMP